jgi:hypothetical protein
MIYEPSTYPSKWRRGDKNKGVRSLLKNLNLLGNYRTHRRCEKMIYSAFFFLRVGVEVPNNVIKFGGPPMDGRESSGDRKV